MLVSVITAVYNGDFYLEEAIQSILSQTYSNLEYIIINDGSTDRTTEILNKIKDPRVRVIHFKQNQGAAHSLNIGIEHSSGGLIAIQDADDISMPTRLEEQVSFLSKNVEYIGVGSLIKCIQGKIPVSENQLISEQFFANQFITADEIISARFFGCPLVHGSVTFYKDVFKQIGGYNPLYKIAYDYDLWLRILEVSKIAKIPSVLYYWRVNHDSLSHRNANDTCNEMLKSLTFAIGRKLTKENRVFTLGVCGTKKACNNHQKQINSFNEFNINYYLFGPSNMNKILMDYFSGKIDGLILLHNFSSKSEKMYNKLSSNGMKPNQTLFKVWNNVN